MGAVGTGTAPLHAMLRIAFSLGLTIDGSSFTVSPATLGSVTASMAGHGKGLEIVTCSAEEPEALSWTFSLSTVSGGRLARLPGFAKFPGIGKGGRGAPGGAPDGPPVGKSAGRFLGRGGLGPNGVIGKSFLESM